MTDEEWAIKWSNGRLSKEDAKDLIEGYWYGLSKLKRPPTGIFADAFTVHVLSSRPNVKNMVPTYRIRELVKHQRDLHTVYANAVIFDLETLIEEFE